MSEKKVQLSEINVEAFQKAGYSFEEIKEMQESVREFNETGKGYSIDEVFDTIETWIYEQAKKAHV